MKIEVIEYNTGKIVKTLDVSGKSEQAIDRIDIGLNINLNHDRFYTRLSTGPETCPHCARYLLDDDKCRACGWRALEDLGAKQ